MESDVKQIETPSIVMGEKLVGKLSFRLEPDHEREIRAKAANDGLGLSDFARKVLLDTPPPIRRRAKARTVNEKALGLVLGALMRIGTNINQIARIANTQGYLKFEEFRILENLRAEIQATRSDILHVFDEEP